MSMTPVGKRASRRSSSAPPNSGDTRQRRGTVQAPAPIDAAEDRVDASRVAAPRRAASGGASAHRRRGAARSSRPAVGGERGDLLGRFGGVRARHPPLELLDVERVVGEPLGERRDRPLAQSRARCSASRSAGHQPARSSSSRHAGSIVTARAAVTAARRRPACHGGWSCRRRAGRCGCRRCRRRRRRGRRTS